MHSTTEIRNDVSEQVCVSQFMSTSSDVLLTQGDGVLRADMTHKVPTKQSDVKIVVKSCQPTIAINHQACQPL